MEIVTLLALALAPVAFIFTYVYLRDEYEREPLKYLIITFLLGILIAGPVILLGEYLEEVTEITVDTESIWKLLIYAFLIVATTEEVMKYLVLRLYNYPHKQFDEPYDGIMYGVAVSMGFAAIENVLYVVFSDDGYQTGLVRMFTAVPAHAMFGALMGYFAGKAKFLENRKRAWMELTKGLLIAILFHGIYDYFIFLGDEYLAGFALVSLVVGLFLARKAMKLHADISPHRFEDIDPADLLASNPPKEDE